MRRDSIASRVDHCRRSVIVTVRRSPAGACAPDQPGAVGGAAQLPGVGLARLVGLAALIALGRSSADPDGVLLDISE